MKPTCVTIPFVMIGLTFAAPAATLAQPTSVSEQNLTFTIDELARRINDYRAENKLPPLPLSGKFTNIARAHVLDAMKNRTGWNGRSLHSWGTTSYNADTADALNKQARDLTGYAGAAYEVSMVNSEEATAQGALNLWRKSDAHSDTILGRGRFANYQWTTMGVCLGGNYAYAWFGVDADDTAVDHSQARVSLGGFAEEGFDAAASFPGAGLLEQSYKAYKFEFDAGKSYTIHLVGKFDTYLLIRDSAKKLIAQNDDIDLRVQNLKF